MKFILAIIMAISSYFHHRESMVPPPTIISSAPTVATTSVKILPPSVKPPIEQTGFQKELLTLTNRERITPLKIDAYMNILAGIRAQYLCTHSFSHEGFTELLDTTKYPWIGENLAKNFGDDATATNMALMDSSDHKKNIQDPHYQFMGIGHTCNITVEFFGGYE